MQNVIHRYYDKQIDRTELVVRVQIYATIHGGETFNDWDTIWCPITQRCITRNKALGDDLDRNIINFDLAKMEKKHGRSVARAQHRHFDEFRMGIAVDISFIGVIFDIITVS